MGECERASCVEQLAARRTDLCGLQFSTMIEKEKKLRTV